MTVGNTASSCDIAARTLELLAGGKNDLYRRLQAEFDVTILKQVWEASGGNQVRMAEILGLSRMTLRSKLRACGLLADDSTP